MGSRVWGEEQEFTGLIEFGVSLSHPSGGGKWAHKLQ